MMTKHESGDEVVEVEALHCAASEDLEKLDNHGVLGWLLVKIEMMKERFSKLLLREDLVAGMVFVPLWLSRFQLQISVVCSFFKMLVDMDPSEPNGSGNMSSEGAVFATCSSKLALLGHGQQQLVDYLLKNHGEKGIHEFCQRWRQATLGSLNRDEIAKGSTSVVEFDSDHENELKIIGYDSSKNQFKFYHIFRHEDNQDGKMCGRAEMGHVLVSLAMEWVGLELD
ncbi:hypothetical protein L1987_45542 [Smallanthus sonchifolius]|uniref:Uncharacterized protein n=1 Tax=Smallanthus sonchifolius TaxID=185202 RepID=A0ACB9FYA7_9ASTR|nr:hypothetical protein L1987_45542 [Smallanthus sonchifolius]